MTANMEESGQNPNAKDDEPLWAKYAVGCGLVIIGILFPFCVATDCILAGIWFMFKGHESQSQPQERAEQQRSLAQLEPAPMNEQHTDSNSFSTPVVA